MSIPDTALMATVKDAAGNTKTLDSHAPDPYDRPTGITCGSQQGSGFYTGSFTLTNPIDRERDDLHLRDKVQLVGANGDIAYEGFVTDLPRSTDGEGSGTLTVQLAGYMADAGRQTFRMPFVDRDFGNWRPASRARLINLLSQTYRNTDAQVLPDVTSGQATLLTEIGDPNWSTGVLPSSEAWYDAGDGAKVALVFYDWERAADVDSASAWQWFVGVNSVDDGSVAFDLTANLKAATSTPAYFTPPTAKRFGWLFFGHTTGPTTGQDGRKFGIYWKRIAVYGNHGLPLIGTDPKGVAASDVIRYLVDTYCPKLNTGGVQDTTYPIAHLTFRERTKVYDGLLKVNSFHLWQLAVWEGGTVHYGPVDMSDWDWEIRHDEVGNQIALQGDSVENLRNGIIVSFTNVATGAVEELHPGDHAELRDDSIDNPFNLHGDREYGEPFSIPFPTTQANALELGRLRLVEDNQVKAPGSFTVGPWIKDRSGQLQPAWKIRAGDRIRLTSSASLSDRPRLIHECQYSHDSRTATVAVDSTLRFLEAYVDRVTTALTAAGLQT